MVKKIQARARIAHKLARYVRATSVHLPSGSSAAQPSVSHLGIILINHSPWWSP
jgi:hypothetical protein